MIFFHVLYIFSQKKKNIGFEVNKDTFFYHRFAVCYGTYDGGKYHCYLGNTVSNRMRIFHEQKYFFYLEDIHMSLQTMLQERVYHVM